MIAVGRERWEAHAMSSELSRRLVEPNLAVLVHPDTMQRIELRSTYSKLIEDRSDARYFPCSGRT